MSFSAREDLIAYRWTISDDVGVDVQENVQQRGVTCHLCVCVCVWKCKWTLSAHPHPNPNSWEETRTKTTINVHDYTFGFWRGGINMLLVQHLMTSSQENHANAEKLTYTTCSEQPTIIRFQSWPSVFITWKDQCSTFLWTLLDGVTCWHV